MNKLMIVIHLLFTLIITSCAILLSHKEELKPLAHEILDDVIEELEEDVTEKKEKKNENNNNMALSSS